MNLTFSGGWSDPANNDPVYAGDERIRTQREIYVIIDNITRSDVGCDDSERISVSEFIRDDLIGGNQVRVDKGVHADKLQYVYGKHITVTVMDGPRAGNVYHLYGRVIGRVWTVEYINRYNPAKFYARDYFVHAIRQPAPFIVVENHMPPATKGSQADIHRSLYGPK